MKIKFPDEKIKDLKGYHSFAGEEIDRQKILDLQGLKEFRVSASYIEVHDISRKVKAKNENEAEEIIKDEYYYVDEWDIFEVVEIN